MNRLARELARACAGWPLEEKWLLAPSYRVGWQWLESVARSGQPVLNAHVRTVMSMAFHLAAPRLAARGLAVASGRAADFLVEETLDALRAEGLSYLGGVSEGPDLIGVIGGAIAAVRGAGLGPEALDPARFEARAKGEDLRRILAGYLERLRAEKMVDTADILEMARREIESGEWAGDPFLLIPADLDLSLLERRLIDAFPAERRLDLPVDDASGWAPGDGRGDPPAADPAGSIHAPDAPWRGAAGGTVLMMRAVGEVNEVRGVLRYCREQEIAWDEVEILHTDPGTYIPLILETLLALEGNDGSTAGASADPSIDSDLPVTFREGIPCGYARPGRALIGWIRWIAEEYPQAALVAMIRDGLLEIPGPEAGGAHSGFGRLAALLRGVGIGFGRSRYLRKIDARIAGLTHRLTRVGACGEGDVRPAGEEHGEGQPEGAARDLAAGGRGERAGPPAPEELSPARRAALERDLRDLRALRALVSTLFTCVPRHGATRRDAVAGARRFLETAARSAGRVDAYARRRLLDDLGEMETWFSRGGDRPAGTAWRWIEDLARGARVLGSGPRPGRLHVDSVDRGGHSGRPYTFVLGLDDARFPGVGLPDPLLLDHERKRLSDEIPRAADRLERRIEDFGRLLARLRGRVALSYPCRDLGGDRDRFPASVLLDAFRIVTGDPEGDPGAFARWLPPPASFAPTRPAGCLDPGEWWTWRMAGPDAIADGDALLLGRYPHLAAGREARAARASGAFTAWDGRVPDAGLDLDPTAEGGPVMSANRFETLGVCPLRWFFEYGLEIAPPDDVGVDITRWLDPLARGSLLHEVFETFLREIVSGEADAGPLLDPDRDAGRLERILDECVRRYADLYPPPSESVYRAEVRDLEGTARMFLAEEARHLGRTGRRPRFLEASLGMRADGPPGALDRAEPIAVVLPGGATIRARGRIDRVDELPAEGCARARSGGEAAYVILDYKTGGDWGYSRSDPFREGRRAQPWLYVEMADRVLGEAIAPGAHVERFGYFFPGPKAAGARYEWPAARLAEGGAVVEVLCRLVAAGAFPPTDEPGDCRYCDYRPICGDVEAVAASSRVKGADRVNAILEPFRWLRHGDRGEEDDDGAGPSGGEGG